MDCNKNSNGIAKVLLMKYIFKILCAFVFIASVLNPATASEKLAPAGLPSNASIGDSKQGPEIFVQLGHNQCYNSSR